MTADGELEEPLGGDGRWPDDAEIAAMLRSHYRRQPSPEVMADHLALLTEELQAIDRPADTTPAGTRPTMVTGTATSRRRGPALDRRLVALGVRMALVGGIAAALTMAALSAVGREGTGGQIIGDVPSTIAPADRVVTPPRPTAPPTSSPTSETEPTGPSTTTPTLGQPSTSTPTDRVPEASPPYSDQPQGDRPGDPDRPDRSTEPGPDVEAGAEADGPSPPGTDGEAAVNPADDAATPETDTSFPEPTPGSGDSVAGESGPDDQSATGESEPDDQSATGESEPDDQSATGESGSDDQSATGESEPAEPADDAACRPRGLISGLLDLLLGWCL